MRIILWLGVTRTLGTVLKGSNCMRKVENHGSMETYANYSAPKATWINPEPS